MAEEAGKAQQEDVAPPATLETLVPGENQEATDNQPVNKTEQQVTAIPVNGVDPSAGAEAVSSTPGKTEGEGAAPKISALAMGTAQESPKPTPSGEDPGAVPPVPRSPHDSVVTEVAAKIPETLHEVIPDKITQHDIEKAEEASVKMLAANLNAPTPTNGSSNNDVEMKEAPLEPPPQSVDESPVVGEKRKAADPAEASDVSGNKKSTIETLPVAESTNGSLRGGKVGRPKKDKKAPALVGQTARRTRSQGRLEI